VFVSPETPRGAGFALMAVSLYLGLFFFQSFFRWLKGLLQRRGGTQARRLSFASTTREILLVD